MSPPRNNWQTFRNLEAIVTKAYKLLLLGIYCNHRVYHANGRIAFFNCGNALGCDARLYYENGNVAWDGRPKGVCYHPNGTILQQGCDGLTISVGAGIDLTASLTANVLSVFGHRILL
jgi:hypothetical protein